MRLLEIKIKVYDGKASEIFDDDSNDEDSIAVIDLDCVSSVYKNPKGEICVYLNGGESYWVYNYTLEEFVILLETMKPNMVPDKATTGLAVSCPDCGSVDVTSFEGNTICSICKRIIN